MRSSSLISAAGLCLAVVVATPPVHAFCRTTTSKIPNGYDPTVYGCLTEGTPLAWHVSRVPVGLIAAASSQISLADATRVEDLALATWNQVLCAGQSPSIQAYDDGPIAQVPQSSGCMSSDSCDAAANDYVVFDDSGWPNDDPANALGLTTVTFGKDDGRIFAAYTEINTAQNRIVAEEPPPAGAYDLQAILTHETGHFFGLAHSPDSTAVMFAYYHPEAVDLTPDDEDGFCSIYPPGGSQTGDPSGNGCACAVRSFQEEKDAFGLAAPALLSIGVLATAAGLRRRVAITSTARPQGRLPPTPVRPVPPSPPSTLSTGSPKVAGRRYRSR